MYLWIIRNQRLRASQTILHSGAAASVFFVASCLGPEIEDADADLEAVAWQSQDEMIGGTVLLGNERERAGVYTLGVTCVGANVKFCTASALYVSASGSESWVVTAAHCLCDYGSAYLYSADTVYRNGQIDTNTMVPNSGVTQEDWFTHPAWSEYSNPPTSTQMAHDIALIRYSTALPLKARDGTPLTEFVRPIYNGYYGTEIGYSTAAFGTGRTTGSFCANTGVTDGTTRWDIFASSKYADGVLVGTQWKNGEIQFGDSGGPWLLRHATWTTNLDGFLEDGMLVGVTAKSFCYQGTTHTEDYAGFVGVASNLNFITGLMGGHVFITSNLGWRKNTGGSQPSWDCCFTQAEKAGLLLAATSGLL